jgi:hypothetical protein
MSWIHRSTFLWGTAAKHVSYRFERPCEGLIATACREVRDPQRDNCKADKLESRRALPVSFSLLDCASA